MEGGGNIPSSLRHVHTFPHLQVPNEAPSEAWLTNFYQNEFYHCSGGTGSRAQGAEGRWGTDGDDSSEEEEDCERAEQDNNEEAEMELQRWEDMCAGDECVAALKQLQAERAILLGMQVAASCGSSGGGSGGGGGPVAQPNADGGAGGGRGGDMPVSQPDADDGKGRVSGSRPDCGNGDGREGDGADGNFKRRRRHSASDIAEGGVLPMDTLPCCVISDDSPSDSAAVQIIAATIQIPAKAVHCCRSQSRPRPALSPSPLDITLGSSQQLGGCSPMVIGEEAGGDEAGGEEAAAAREQPSSLMAKDSPAALAEGGGGSDGAGAEGAGGEVVPSSLMAKASPAAEEGGGTDGAAAAGEEEPNSPVDAGGGDRSLSDRLRDNLDAQIDAIVRCMEAVHLSRRPLIQKVCLLA